MDNSRFQRQLDLILKNPPSYGINDCILCGREVIAMIGVCFPSETLAKKLNQPAGKIRTVFYGLCEECSREGQAAADKVEAEVIKSLDKGEPINLIT